jgi:hypothetical protein
MVLSMNVDSMIFAAMKRPVTVEKPMVRLCGWCEGARERTLEAVASGATVSHTICPSCSAKALGEIK